MAERPEDLGLPPGSRLIYEEEPTDVEETEVQQEEPQPLRQEPITGAISPEEFEQLTPEEQAQAGAGIGPNVPADVPSIPVPEEQMSSAEFAEQRKADRTFMEHLEREILPTAGSIIGPLLLASPQGRALRGISAALRLGKTALAAGAGGAVGETAQITNEYLRGDIDAPEDSFEITTRLAKEAAWGAGGEVLGFGAIRAGNLATKAFNAAKAKAQRVLGPIEATLEKVPGTKQLLEWKSAKYMDVEKKFHNFGGELAENAYENLTPQQLTDLSVDIIQGGHAAANTYRKSLFKELDANPALRTTRVIGQEPTGFVDRLGNPIMKDVTEDVPNAISTIPIKSFAENRLTRFATGKSSEGMTVVVRPESKQLAASVLEELNKIPDNVGFADSFVLKNEILGQAITAAKELGDDSLVNNLKAIQNRIGSVMEANAKRIGGETEEVYFSLKKDFSKISQRLNNEFADTVFMKNPVQAGRRILPELDNADIIKMKDRIMVQEGGADAWAAASTGYLRNIVNKSVDEKGVIREEKLVEMVSTPEAKRKLKAVLGEEGFEKFQELTKILRDNSRKPGEVLINLGAWGAYAAGFIDPMTSGAITGVVSGGKYVSRGVEEVGKAKDFALDVLGRMLIHPAKAEILKKALTIKASAPQAARVMAQLNMAVVETIEEIGIPTDIGLASEGGKGLPVGKTPPGARLIDPGAEDQQQFESEDATKHGLPPGARLITPEVPKQDKPSSGSQATQATTEKGVSSEESWIQKYQQVNPGVSRQEAIKEGKRLGKVPKNYKSPPLGIRNNNPGNIRVSPISWKGKVEGHTGPFEKFRTPEDGIRAMTVNLRTYHNKYGLNTVSDIISRWAPPSENATGSYINIVARSMGVKPNEKLDLNDPKIMKKLVEAIIEVENGKMPYEEATLTKGVKSAYG